MTLTVLIISSIITMWALYKRREESIIIFIGIIAAWAAYYFNIAFAGLATTMVICTSFSIARQFARNEKAEREAQLKSTRLENELLKKNINPHFVLNTLTSIIAWLRKDSGSAIKLIEALAEEFRMINQISTLKQIPIVQEIDLCRAHLKIMSYRKGADYKLETIDIDEKDTIPPMIFHTLVENGITHGYENKIAGTFKLQRIKNSNSTKYVLTNDGDFNPEESKGSTGFGAKYIKGRLEESYPGEWDFTSSKSDQGWESIVEIRNRLMRILIVEDERPTAEDIKLLVEQILGKEIFSIHIETTLDSAMFYLKEKPIDVLLLDLNLNAKDGFDLLKQVVSQSFHTIVISANINRAIEAFEYGVLDFIPKPYNLERLKAAFQRLKSSHALDGHSIKYLSVKKGFEIKVIPLEEIKYFKSANIYVELHLQNDQSIIYDKSIKQLIPLLPSNYYRIHKSYIVDRDKIESIQSLGGGKYRVILKSGECLPVSRHKINQLKNIGIYIQFV